MQMKLRRRTLDRMAERTADLSERFEQCLEKFRQNAQFGGPSLHFHLRAINRLRSHSDPAGVLEDEQYFEYLYAALVSWGLHRMGPGGAKLQAFPVFLENARSLLGRLTPLFGRSILDLRDDEVSGVARQLGDAIERHKRVKGLTQAECVLVANTKALHHFLPDLVPPLDRAYTLVFFFNRTDPPGSESETFCEVFPHFARSAQANGALIRREVARGIRGQQHTDWNSGHAKVVDNALIGWVRSARGAGRPRPAKKE